MHFQIALTAALWHSRGRIQDMRGAVVIFQLGRFCYPSKPTRLGTRPGAVNSRNKCNGKFWTCWQTND